MENQIYIPVRMPTISEMYVWLMHCILYDFVCGKQTNATIVQFVHLLQISIHSTHHTQRQQKKMLKRRGDRTWRR